MSNQMREIIWVCRKTSGSWMRESETMDDGCAWRKYGQKNILNSKYPRYTHSIMSKLIKGLNLLYTLI